MNNKRILCTINFCVVFFSRQTKIHIIFIQYCQQHMRPMNFVIFLCSSMFGLNSIVRYESTPIAYIRSNSTFWKHNIKLFKCYIGRVTDQFLVKLKQWYNKLRLSLLWSFFFLLKCARNTRTIYKLNSKKKTFSEYKKKEKKKKKKSRFLNIGQLIQSIYSVFIN